MEIPSQWAQNLLSFSPLSPFSCPLACTSFCLCLVCSLIPPCWFCDHIPISFTSPLWRKVRVSRMLSKMESSSSLVMFLLLMCSVNSSCPYSGRCFWITFLTSLISCENLSTGSYRFKKHFLKYVREKRVLVCISERNQPFITSFLDHYLVFPVSFCGVGTKIWIIICMAMFLNLGS